MPQYRYKARNARGEAVEGHMEAGSSDMVADLLFNSELSPIDISLVQERPNSLEELRLRLGLARVPLMDLIMFSRQMYTLLRAGVPMIRTILGLADTTRNMLLTRTLREVTEHLENGRPLSEGLGAHPKVFSSLYVSIIQVGENTGQLDTTFLQMARYLELEKDTRDRVRAALRYPLLVLAAISVAVGVINLMVVPSFAGVFTRLGADLPWQTKALVGVSDFTLAWWPLLLAGLAAAVGGFLYAIRTPIGRYQWDRYKLRIPLTGGIIERATLGRFARSFSLALKAGVPLIQAMTVVAQAVDNQFVAARLLDMRGGIERGETLTRTAAASGMFSPLVLQMLAVGEETGAVGELLEQVAEYYEREVDYDLKRLSASIEPILIIIIGVLVLILALGVFLPVWDLTGVMLR